jgi:hypothetical protein
MRERGFGEIKCRNFDRYSAIYVNGPVQEAEERVTSEMRRSLEEQQAEWERILRTNRDKAEQEKRTIINRSALIPYSISVDRKPCNIRSLSCIA